MEVEPTVSQISSSQVSVGPGVNSPIIAERKATTTVSVQNGQSVVIGGLISTTDDKRQNKVPFLGDIPFLGALFRSSHNVQNRKELLIILTPQLLLDSRDARRISTAELRNSTIKDEIKRDKLQETILNPILPYFYGGTNGIPQTNSVTLPPKSKEL
jgi:type II secretory pathway component GspD/PulD (secretin)